MGLWRWKRHVKHDRAREAQISLADEPLSQEEELTLDQAAQISRPSDNYFTALPTTYPPSGSTGSSLPKIPSATAPLSIESLLNAPPQPSPTSSPSATSSRTASRSNTLTDATAIYSSTVGSRTVSTGSSAALRRRFSRLSMIVMPKHSGESDDSRSNSRKLSRDGSWSPDASSGKVEDLPSLDAYAKALGSSKSPATTASLLKSAEITHDNRTTSPQSQSGPQSSKSVSPMLLPTNTNYAGVSPQPSAHSPTPNRAGRLMSSLPPISTTIGGPGSPNIPLIPAPFRSNSVNRDDSISPMNGRSSFSESPRMSSPASSLIFERSVQDFSSLDGSKVPLHYQNDDFIPPVLDASTSIITDSSIDPNSIEIVSMFPVSKPASRSRSMSVLHEPAAASPVKLSSPQQPQYAASASSPADRHILSFFSFADVVSAESPHPEGSAGSSPRLRSSTSSPRLHSPSSRRLSRHEYFDASEDLSGLDEDSGLMVRSMKETLRKTTGEISSQLHETVRHQSSVVSS